MFLISLTGRKVERVVISQSQAAICTNFGKHTFSISGPGTYARLIPINNDVVYLLDRNMPRT